MTNPSPTLHTLRALRSAAAAATIGATARPFRNPPLHATSLIAFSLLPGASTITRSITTTHHHRRPKPSRDIHTSPSHPIRPIRPDLPSQTQASHRKEEASRTAPNQPPPTDFGQLDVLASAPVPSTAVDVCRSNGFELNSGVSIKGAGALLVGGEAFQWKPWEAESSGKEGRARKRRLVNEKGQWEVSEEAFGLLGLVWPRPDLLILGTGPEIRPLSPATRQIISNLGMRVEVLDTRNAASQYNLLATERGVDNVAAALVPLGWKDDAE
ncbi:hypothetical protein VTJ83DRAFT_1293 [Remersonia thermophila]|uniref:NADH dehydrogenase [ubiquinone] 1 alpha subcomplex assembly factor 3 n=1 Tax=Remersonia thermophila TaxID=72144 RepID=A0ABR4DQM6_9PEZI